MAPIQKKLTGRERAAIFRQRHSDTVREKNKERMRAIREKQKIQRQKNKEEYERHKTKETNRKRLYRERKKIEVENTPSTSQPKNTYKSPQAFGKAVRKSMRALPDSPTKKIVIVSAIATNLGLNMVKKELNVLSDEQSYNLIKEFFYRPDIVYTAPGMKDEMTVWQNGEKAKLRKYYLTTYLKEAYSIFKDENPNCSTSFSTFCKLRPENVLLMQQTPEDQCKCITCENFFLQLKALKIHYDSKLFWQKMLCDDSLNSKCWQGICELCNKGQKIQFTENLSKNIYWKKWAKNENAQISCQMKETCNGEVLDCFCGCFSAISSHINTKRIQYLEFTKDKSCAEKRVLQFDFAMNYSCSYQDEVQSALWSRKSVALFTAAVFVNGECSTFLICSDTSEKEKNTVRAFIAKIYEEITMNPNKNDNIQEEIIWTDGPSSEFKNRYMTLFLQELSTKFKKPFFWKYYATSHGKGVVDGIGGKAKCLVRDAVRSKKPTAPIVQSAEDFAKVVKNAMPSTRVILYLDKDINRDNSVWDISKPIPGISKMHGIKYSPLSGLEFFTNALTPIKLNDDNGITNPLTISQGNWVVVRYEDNLYAGEVIQIIGSEMEVSCMEKSGKYWKWPKKEDKLMYNINEVVKIIQPPEVINARGVFDFKDF